MKPANAALARIDAVLDATDALLARTASVTSDETPRSSWRGSVNLEDLVVLRALAATTPRPDMSQNPEKTNISAGDVASLDISAAPTPQPAPRLKQMYLDDLAARIYHATDSGEVMNATDALLYRLYALLARTAGPATTLEDVHDAWAIWRTVTRPDHPAIVPFAELSAEEQAKDRPYVDAIRAVAEPQPAPDALREALTWYAIQAAGCRKVTSEGNEARRLLDSDGGQRARAALAEAGA